MLYLDLDDTLISWRGGSPHAAPGAREFMIWALRRYEVRWLTTWCPGGEMEDRLLHDLARMLELGSGRLRAIRGFDWEGTGSKLNGIAWLEHVVLGRAFLWVEDDRGVGPREIGFLEEHGFPGAYRRVNVTKDPGSLRTLHRALRRETLGAGGLRRYGRPLRGAPARGTRERPSPRPLRTPRTLG